MLAFVLFCLFVFIVVLMLVFARMSVLATRLGDLEKKLRDTQVLIAGIEKPAPGEKEKPVVVRKGGLDEPRDRVSPVRRPIAPETGVPASIPAAPVTPQALPAAPPVRAKSRSKEEWEALIGGKLLNRIGALALILGVGFFLQYAFANDWITEPVRVLIGVLLGIGLLAGAARSASGGFQIFAQGLVGAGIAILYLSVYASFNYYHLVAQPWAFVFMTAVTVITFTQAFRYDSIVVALLGLTGGFLTPFLLSTGEMNPAGLFTYLALLDLGLLAVAWRRDAWMSIEPLSMFGTYFTYSLWLAQGYTETNFLTGFLFLALFWVMFHAIHTVRIVRNITSYARIRLVFASMHGATVYVLLYILVNNDHPQWRVPATLGAAILYGATSLAARKWPGDEGVFLHSLLTAILLVVCATWIQFKGLALVQYWSIEALALAWAGSQWRLRPVIAGALALIAAAILQLLFTRGALIAPVSEPFTILFNSRAFTFLLLSACIALSAVLRGRSEETGHTGVRMLLHVAWSWTLFTLFTAETIDFFAQMIRSTGVAREQYWEFLRVMTLPAVWGAWAVALIVGGSRNAVRPIVLSGVMMILMAVCLGALRGLMFAPIGDFEPVLNMRVLLLLLLIAECVIARRALLSQEGYTGVYRTFAPGLQGGIVLLFLVLITGETWDFYARGIYRLALMAGSITIADELNRLQNLRQLFLSGGWLVYSIILMAIGIWRRARVVRIEAIILFGVSILKIFIYDLSFLDTLYRIFSFAGLGIILLAVSYLYQRYRGIILGSA